MMKFSGALTLSVVVAALAFRADAMELAHDAASLARALTAQGGAGVKFDFSAVVTYVCTNSFGRSINIAAEDASRSEERRVEKECYQPCRSRWSPYH